LAQESCHRFATEPQKHSGVAHSRKPKTLTPSGGEMTGDDKGHLPRARSTLPDTRHVRLRGTSSDAYDSPRAGNGRTEHAAVSTV
jgi:hypothetical protein